LVEEADATAENPAARSSITASLPEHTQAILVPDQWNHGSAYLEIDEVIRPMSLPAYSSDDLKLLPLRGIAAFAARCARRVERLALLPEHHPDATNCKEVVSKAIGLAEDFARGVPPASREAVAREAEALREAAQGDLSRQDAVAAVVQAAYTAITALDAVEAGSDPGEAHLLRPPTVAPTTTHLAQVTAELAALNAYSSAVDAADAAGHSEEFIESMIRDYQKLIRLQLGSYPEAGKPVDPSPDGPLGPLLQ
jgi:hypothetical protein